MIVLLLFVVVICIITKIVTRDRNPERVPGRIQVILERLITGFDSFFTDASEGKFKRTSSYILGLAFFLAIGNLLPIFGFESVSANYNTTFTIAAITWIAIFVFGSIYNRWRYFKQILNPLELFGKIPLLISLSFRLFGNILGGSIVTFLVYFATYKLQALILNLTLNYNQFPNFLSIIVMPLFRVYFDVFDGLLQAFIFVILTINY